MMKKRKHAGINYGIKKGWIDAYCIYIRTWQYIFSVYVSTVVYRYVYVMLWFRYGGYKYRHFATEIILLPK